MSFKGAHPHLLYRLCVIHYLNFLMKLLHMINVSHHQGTHLSMLIYWLDTYRASPFLCLQRVPCENMHLLHCGSCRIQWFFWSLTHTKDLKSLDLTLCCLDFDHRFLTSLLRLCGSAIQNHSRPHVIIQIYHFPRSLR